MLKASTAKTRATADAFTCVRCREKSFPSAKSLSNHEGGCDGMLHLQHRQDDYHRDGTEKISHLRKKIRTKERDVDPAETDDHFDACGMWDCIHLRPLSSTGLVDGATSENAGAGEVRGSYYTEYYADPEEGVGPYADYDPDPAGVPKIPYDAENAGVSASSKFQIELANVCMKHKVNLSMYDDLVKLLQNHSGGADNKLNFPSRTLQPREQFIKGLYENFGAKNLKPKDVPVELGNGTEVTVSIFDLEAMILSLLTDPSLMRKENIAKGYDLHTGKPTEPVTHYGEVHTGDAWEPARKYFCGEHDHHMPVGLILFIDKTQVDLHGTLGTTPVCFTLTCFNEKARNRPEFWRPLCYIPNLSYGKTEDKESVEDVQDEHRCYEKVLHQLVLIHERGGINARVLGKDVVCKVWIHFIIGDAAGNNRILAVYNNQLTYRDCNCLHGQMGNPNPNCQYRTREDVENALDAMRDESATAGQRQEAGKAAQLHNVENAFMAEDVPLSDLIHGILVSFFCLVAGESSLVVSGEMAPRHVQLPMTLLLP